MVSINVCFSTTDRLFSRFIRWFMRSKVSHGLITFRSETLGKVLLMEAVGRGFVISPWSGWRQTHQLCERYELTIPEETQRQALSNLSDHLGAEYDKFGLVGFWARRFRTRMRNPFHSTDKLFCSEAVALFLSYCGLSQFDHPEEWSPQDLLTEVKQSDKFVCVETR